jgi:glyoxylase-like metal-dependent hydrolase (beta-lactamase superfamily II)
MLTLAAGVSYIDLEFQGHARLIATAVLHGPSGVALVDPGPSSALPVLRRELAMAGMAVGDVTTIVLTHIHLDHAGATGSLVREHPAIRVFVHEKGAPHLIDPSRLRSSAARLYGDAMERLWGELAPVPSAALHVLRGGERIEAAGRRLAVAYTPGHATHHVSYFNAETGIALIGDMAGIRLSPGGVVLPPTPPPDIDLELWLQSLSTIEAWRPDTLFLTHFGPHTAHPAHLAELREHLDLTSRLVGQSLVMEGEDLAREEWFSGEVRKILRQRMSEALTRTYEVVGRFDLNWRGLARYLRKKQLVGESGSA